MIEVLFGESEAGSMKAAKCKVIGGKTDGPTAVWTSGKKKFSKKEFSGWIQGTSEEVICLGFMLDIGDIREAVDSQYRKDLIYSLYAQDQWGKDSEADAELKRVADVYANEMIRLKKYLESEESIRIWYSDAPYSRCGFYSLCTVLQKYENEIYAVKLPEYSVRENFIVMHHSWNEVAAEEFAAFLPYETKVSQKELRMYAGLWNDLVEDNSPLRAMVNGRVVGVPEDFYDFLIWKRLTKEPVKEARLIGDILGKYQIGIGDWWYAKRIEYFIRQGEIKVAEDSENKYARMICRADG